MPRGISFPCLACRSGGERERASRGCYRSISKEYERLKRHSEAVGMIKLEIRAIVGLGVKPVFPLPAADPPV